VSAHSDKVSLSNVIRAIGTVFGDIGTSPLYTFAVIVLVTKPKPDEILGIASLMVWTLILIPTVQYAWFAMNLSLRGEGSIIALGEIAQSINKNPKTRMIHRALTIVGIGFRRFKSGSYFRYCYFHNNNVVSCSKIWNR